MAALKHTPLRHQMLALAATGRMQYIPGWGRTQGRFDLVDTPPVGGQKTALRWCVDNRLVDREVTFGFAVQKVYVSDSGRALLTEWNEKHGNPLE